MNNIIKKAFRKFHHLIRRGEEVSFREWGSRITIAYSDDESNKISNELLDTDGSVKKNKINQLEV